MVRVVALALSGAALVATASSFLAPSRPLGAFSPASSGIRKDAKLSEVTAKDGLRPMRRGRVAMSSTQEEGRNGEGGGERYYGPTSKPLLDSVQSPSDMKRFSIGELKQLAYELRWETLEVSAMLTARITWSHVQS